LKERPIYQVKQLVHRYWQEPVLQVEDLSISQNSIVGLVGPNGSGKSTLLKMLAFIEKPTSGTVFFEGKPVEPFSDTVRFQVTFLTQTPYLMKRTVFRNIKYGLQLRGDTDNIKKKVYESLALVGLSGESFAHRKWYELSGGEAQRVALAARLILKPKVLLLDEPTANVDVDSSRLIREASLRAREKCGTTLVIASHDLEWLSGVCDNIIYLFRGRLSGNRKTNIIFGPFTPLSGGFYEKNLGKGQGLVVPRPPHENAAAVIDPEKIHVFSKEDLTPSTGKYLRGIITRLVLEKETGNIAASVLIGSFEFCANLSHKQSRYSVLYRYLYLIIQDLRASNLNFLLCRLFCDFLRA